jgi:hypothetical protein
MTYGAFYTDSIVVDNGRCPTGSLILFLGSNRSNGHFMNMPRVIRQQLHKKVPLSACVVHLQNNRVLARLGRFERVSIDICQHNETTTKDIEKRTMGANS